MAQLGLYRNTKRERFVFDLFLKVPTLSIRKAQARLQASEFGPEMMRTRRIADTRTRAQAHLDGLPGTEMALAVSDAADKLAGDIEKDMYRGLPYPETARKLGGLLDFVSEPPTPEVTQQIRQQFKDSCSGSGDGQCFPS
jgi:hypothetical protein